jgi:hypothetical protein
LSWLPNVRPTKPSERASAQSTGGWQESKTMIKFVSSVAYSLALSVAELAAFLVFFLVVIFSVAFLTPAHAGAAYWSCEHTGSVIDCSYSTSRLFTGAKIIHVPEDTSPEAVARREKWEAYCAPTPHVDEFGVTRFTYAHPRCEYGVVQ